MALQSSCPHCGTSYVLSEQQIGVQVRCLKCNGVFEAKIKASQPSTITTEPGSPVLELAQPEDVERYQRLRSRPDGTPKKEPAKKSLLLPVLVGGGALALLLLLAGAVAGVSAFLYLLSPGPRTAQNPKLSPVARPPARVAVLPPIEDPPPVPERPPAPVAEADTKLDDLKAATVFVVVGLGETRASGAGFFIHTEGDTGYVATNHELIASALGKVRRWPDNSEILIVMNSGTPKEHAHFAEVVGAYPDSGLAILKATNIARLPRPLNLNPAAPLNGEEVVAYGFPFDERRGAKSPNPALTLTRGTVSGVRHNERNEVVHVQIDGALNLGTSGSPVLDAEGRLVGIATPTVAGAPTGRVVPAVELNRVLEGQFGDLVVTPKGASGDKLEATVAATILDPLNRVKSMQVHYLRSDRVPDNLQPENGQDWPELPGAAQVPLEVIRGQAVGTVTIAAADKDRSITFQLSHSYAAGRTVYAKPRAVLLRPLDVEVVRPSDLPYRLPGLPNTWPGLPKPRLVGEDDPRPRPGAPIKSPPPTPFTVHVPDKGNQLVPLGGAVSDVTVAGGGRYLVLHLNGKKKLAIFDVQEGKVVKELPIAEEPYYVAGGANRLVVVYPNAKLIQQWDLKTLERDKSSALPLSVTSDTIHHVSMGSASAGPLFVYLPKEKRTFALNLETMDTTEVRWTYWGRNNGYGPEVMRTSPDGTWLVGYGSVCEIALFHDGVQVASYPQSDFRMLGAGAFALPSADARFLYTPWGILDSSLTLAKMPALANSFVLPSVEPGYFLALAKQGRPDGAQSGVVEDGTLTIYSDDRKPLFVLGDLEELKQKCKLTWEKRVHYYPRSGLLVTLDTAKEQLVLRRVNLAEQLEKSNTDYLVVVSRPPVAKPGSTYAYKIESLSKKGGLKYTLESGPAGLTVSPAGEVSWKVPAMSETPAVVVLVTVTDSSGQEMFHNFKVLIGPPQL